MTVATEFAQRGASQKQRTLIHVMCRERGLSIAQGQIWTVADASVEIERLKGIPKLPSGPRLRQGKHGRWRT
jgi:hypothetical protein